MASAPDSFDLRRFAPPTGVTVKLRHGGEYRIPGDPDVAIMLRLEDQINDAAGVALGKALQEGKETLKRLILSADETQDVSGLKIGAEEMLVVFALLVHGQTVAEAVGYAITAHNTSNGENLDEGDLDDEERAALLAAREGGGEGPLSQSPSSSSERSSGSGDGEASLRATG